MTSFNDITLDQVKQLCDLAGEPYISHRCILSNEMDAIHINTTSTCDGNRDDRIAKDKLITILNFKDELETLSKELKAKEDAT